MHVPTTAGCSQLKFKDSKICCHFTERISGHYQLVYGAFYGRNRHHKDLTTITVQEEELAKRLIEVRAKCFNATIAVQKPKRFAYAAPIIACTRLARGVAKTARVPYLKAESRQIDHMGSYVETDFEA
ncbi:unnamed protein product [Cylicocyclus nassatus]|uniref:Uncharacterized protein n=1 Tax=Cylicocyclus nassatus TaxID=53992 RepID=A0AA36M4G7_CYLNA|nr:unnamed protein product [Cylicocyclus nassatus]